MTTAISARPLRHGPLPRVEAAAGARHQHWYWLAAGLVLFFLLPFGLTDLVSINRDLYYGIYIVAVFGFFAAWLGCAVGSASMLTRNWRAGVVLGLVVAGVMAAIVLNEPATSRPDGLEFVAAIVWRGALYGLADGLSLSAFPILAVFASFAGTDALGRRRGKAAVGALALAVSLLFTAVYHLGYSDFRGDKVRKPIAGDLIWSLPTLATLSPLGAPIAHAGLHVTAVVHSYETDVFLPPHAAGLDTEPLQRVLDQAVAGPDRLAPGATAYISTPAGSWSGAAGLADVKADRAMSKDARLRLDSVSKIWKATLIYQLEADGSLQVSDTVARWLPDLLPYGDQITIKQLLTHTSGLIDNDDIGADPDRYFARVTDPKLKAELIATRTRLEQSPATEFSPLLWIKLAAFQPLLSDPGTQYHYSNIGYEILGLIAERASGQSLATLSRERIFTPLDLGSAAYDPQGPISGPHARGYNLAGTLRDMTAVHGGIAPKVASSRMPATPHASWSRSCKRSC
jgi:CubicO group peptidase (beta-lactamase class C family)